MECVSFIFTGYQPSPKVQLCKAASVLGRPVFRGSELQSMCGNLTGQGGYTARRRVRAMPNFYEYNPEQGYLLPPSVRDVLGKEHLCFFVHGAVEKMDLAA